MMLFDFTQPQTAAEWSPVDDVVMGGMSYSRIRSTAEQHALFSGAVSLENNGGFASVTSPTRVLGIPKEARGISLRVRGDGKTYGVTLRCEDRSRIRYQIHFISEPNLWEVVHLPFDQFLPKRLGAVVLDAPPLKPQTIHSIGLIISGKQDGDFQLALEWIAAYPMTD